MNLLVFLHVVCAGIWLGAALVEVAFEQALDLSPSRRAPALALRWKTDLFIVTPAFLGVAVTGIGMLAFAPLTPLLSAKVAFGAIAVLANAYCVWLARQRLALAEARDYLSFARVDAEQRRWGAVALLGLVAALVVGGAIFLGY